MPAHNRLFLILVVIVGIAGYAGAHEVSAPLRAYVGTAIEVTLDPSVHIDQATAALETASQSVITRTHFFDTAQLSETARGYSAILGIPHNLEAGEYFIRSKVHDIYGELHEYIYPLKIEEREFPHEYIALNAVVSDIRARPDPRKVEQSARLSEIIFSVDTADIYHHGRFWRPVYGGIETSTFGDRRTYQYDDDTSAAGIHYGLDIANSVGTPVIAAGNGKVIFAEERIVTGNTVIIAHLPGLYTLYYHLDTIRVADGQQVVAGEWIGTVGSTGVSTGPHLHWEVRVGGIAVDPALMIAKPLVDLTKIRDNGYTK